MAVGVVYLLKTVQVQGEHRQRMSLALGASDFGGQALLRKTAVIQTSQRINHCQVAEKVRMALFLGKLAAKPLDENCLRDHIGIKEDDESDQAKNNVSHVDLEKSLSAKTHRWNAIGDDGEDEEKGDKNRVPPDPPFVVINSLKLARQVFVSGLYRRRDRMNGRGTHAGGSKRRVFADLSKLVSPVFRVNTIPLLVYKLVPRGRGPAIGAGRAEVFLMSFA